MMNTNYISQTTYPSSGHAQHQSQARPTAPPSAPMYMDLLSDDTYYNTTNYRTPVSTTNTTTLPPPNVVTPTANAVYMSMSPTVATTFPSSSSSSSSSAPAVVTASTASHPIDDKVVMIPSNSVFIEQQNLYNTSSTMPNTHRTTTTTSSPVYSYNDNNQYYREDEAERSPYETNRNNNYYTSNEQYDTYDEQSNHAHNRTAIATRHDDPSPTQRYFNGKPVKAKHAHLPDTVLAFKAERKFRTVAATCTGGAVGLIALGPVLGPFGAVIGATSAYAAAKTVGKHRERKITEHAILQQNYLSSSIRDENAVPLPSSSSSAISPYDASNTGIRSTTEIPIDRAELA